VCTERGTRAIDAAGSSCENDDHTSVRALNRFAFPGAAAKPALGRGQPYPLRDIART